jgi:hypothetical protein
MNKILQILLIMSSCLTQPRKEVTHRNFKSFQHSRFDLLSVRVFSCLLHVVLTAFIRVAYFDSCTKRINQP